MFTIQPEVLPVALTGPGPRQTSQSIALERERERETALYDTTVDHASAGGTSSIIVRGYYLDGSTN